jgi:hypothetical protein
MAFEGREEYRAVGMKLQAEAGWANQHSIDFHLKGSR